MLVRVRTRPGSGRQRPGRPAKTPWLPPFPISTAGAETRAHHLGIAVVLAALSLQAAGCSPAADVDQPVEFQHKIHAAEAEIACTECHIGAEVADHATLPDREICLTCHEEPLGESAEEAHLVDLLAAGEALGWQRVTRVEEDIHFSHRRHVVAGKILCEACHGEVAERTQPFHRAHIVFQGQAGMQRCIGCHQTSGNPRANVDCALCHR